MDIRQPTEKEMIQGIALGFKEFLLSRNQTFGSDLSDHKILETIKISMRHATESITSQKTADQEIISWISVNDELPPLLETVLVHRVGGYDDLDVVGIAYRKHKFGSVHDWKWVETGSTQTYWGVPVDDSQIISWAKRPKGLSNK